MAKVRDIDLGYRAIERELKRLNNSYVLVGIQQGTQTKAQSMGERYKWPGESMAEIGYVNEFGAGNVPARPFIRSTIDERREQINQLINTQYGLILNRSQTANRALAITGLYVEGEIKRKIRSITTPPNAPSTIAKKGSSKPLIDFGQLIQSIVSVVFMN